MNRLESGDTWWLGVAVAAFAVIAGQTAMVLGDAPLHAPWVNFAAITTAAATFPLMCRAAGRTMRWPVWTLWLTVGAVLLTVAFGPDVQGVRRWAGAPPVAIHVGHLVTPLAIAAAVRRPGPWPAVGLAALSLGFALQPDAAALIALSLALAVTLVLRGSVWTGGALIAAGGAAVWTLLNPDTLAPVTWVEAVPQTALAMEVWLGFLVALGLSLLPMPFLFVAVQGHRRRPLAGALAAYWSGLIAASFLAPFPSPLVGYGIGPILGYVLSWALLRAGGREASASQR